MHAMGWDYRQAEGNLWVASDIRRQIGLAEAPSRMTLWRAERRFSEEWLRELNEKVLAAFKKRVYLWRRSSSGCGGLDGARGACAGGVVLVPHRAKALRPPVPQAPRRQRVPRGRTGPDPRVGADRAPRCRRSHAPNSARPHGDSLGPGPRGRGVCRPTERDLCRGAGRGAVLPSEVPVDGAVEGPPGVATDDPAVSSPSGGVPRDVPIPGECGGSVLGNQATSRPLSPRAERGDATTRGRLADDREKCRSTGPGPSGSRGVVSYGTQPRPKTGLYRRAFFPLTVIRCFRVPRSSS
jgi:hypothetical protein